MKQFSGMRAGIAACTVGAVLGLAAAASADDAVVNNVRDRSIAYAVSGGHWGLYQTADGKAECPDGINEVGPRETFKALFPEDGTKRSVVDTQLAREAAIWAPEGRDYKFPFHYAGGKIGLGLNLDGKVGPNDFTSPDGEKGIDNQLFRALGCLRWLRGPDGIGYHFSDLYMREFNYNRGLIELTNVDSLADDSDVDVTIYRGLDDLMADATGAKIMPGGTQRVDTKFGQKFITHLKGKIVAGVLTTEPVKEMYWPFAWFGGNPGAQHILDMRMRLKLTHEAANGFIAGYENIEEWYYGLARGRSTHHLAYGSVSAPGVYKAIHELADAYPDASGKNTAISMAWGTDLTQVFLKKPPQEVAAAAPAQPKAERAGDRR